MSRLPVMFWAIGRKIQDANVLFSTLGKFSATSDRVFFGWVHIA